MSAPAHDDPRTLTLDLLLAAGLFGAHASRASAHENLSEWAAIDARTLHDGHGLYEGGAVFEVIWGGAHLVGAVAMACVFERDGAEIAVPLSAPLAALGGYLLAHGIWSLADPRRGLHSASASHLTRRSAESTARSSR